MKRIILKVTDNPLYFFSFSKDVFPYGLFDCFLPVLVLQVRLAWMCCWFYIPFCVLKLYSSASWKIYKCNNLHGLGNRNALSMQFWSSLLSFFFSRKNITLKIKKSRFSRHYDDYLVFVSFIAIQCVVSNQFTQYYTHTLRAYYVVLFCARYFQFCNYVTFYIYFFFSFFGWVEVVIKLECISQICKVKYVCVSNW